jgi:release factor glutamine methyltransferase
MRTVRSLRNEIAARLGKAGIQGSDAEARLILCSLLDTDTAGLLERYGEPLPEGFEERAEPPVKRREAGEPLQYILGRWEFMGLPFIVKPGVLIPRQDTETLAEHAIGLIKENGYRTVLDLCCGSGCIGISIAKLTCARVTASDIDEDCARLAHENAELNGCEIETAVSDMFENIGHSFDMIVCNPPYIRDADIPKLQREVLREPVKALAGGPDGLGFYRRLQKEAPRSINNGGTLLMEAGAGQADDILRLFGRGYAVKDANGIDRVVVVGY